MGRKVLLLLFLISLTAAASATRIQISEPQCQPGDTDVTQLSNGFSVTPVNGGGTFSFCNDTGQDWTTLLIALRTTVTADQIDCSTSAFESCTKTTNPNVPGVVYAFFSGVTSNNNNRHSRNDDGEEDDDAECPVESGGGNFPGVPNHCEFIVDMNCGANCTAPPDWPKGTVGFGYANEPDDPANFPIPPAVPEPASLVLVSSGIAAAIVNRKRRS